MAQTVLLVEDDSIVRKFVVASLERENLIVLPVCGGAEALEIIGRRLKVDLLLTDVNLGDSMNGFEVAKRIMEEKPGTKVLLMSGFPDKELLATEENVPFLRKPFTLGILTQAVREALSKIPAQS
jgi:DNA-binding NtrC family response regulator